MRKLLVALVVVFLSPAAWSGGIPVFDGTSLAQALKQFQELQRQYEMLKQQYSMLKRQYDSITGSYGMGDLLNDPATRRHLPATWQQVVALQKAGRYGSKQDYYEKLLRTIDPKIFEALGKDTDSRAFNTYRLSADSTRGAFAAVESLYDSIQERLGNIESLQGRIESTPNVKAAADLNNRFIAENAYLNVDMARLSTIQLSLQANAQNITNQSTAARTEFFNFGKQ